MRGTRRRYAHVGIPSSRDALRVERWRPQQLARADTRFLLFQRAARRTIASACARDLARIAAGLARSAYMRAAQFPWRQVRQRRSTPRRARGRAHMDAGATRSFPAHFSTSFSITPDEMLPAIGS